MYQLILAAKLLKYLIASRISVCALSLLAALRRFIMISHSRERTTWRVIKFVNTVSEHGRQVAQTSTNISRGAQSETNNA